MNDQLAITGGSPVRSERLNYGKQTIEADDIEAVLAVLKENQYLTTGPRIKQFEDLVCQKLAVKSAIAVSNGTAAIHCAFQALDLKPDDEVLATALSFVATANGILYCGAKPVFVDIEETTMNIDVNLIEAAITPKTKAMIVVDFAGQLCDYQKLRQLADQHNLILISDAAHSFGLKTSNLADLTVFSFHPVKNITTGEGGMVITNSEYLGERVRRIRNHGIDVNYQNRKLYEYDIVELGFNYRLTDLQAALGISQLKKVDNFLERRNQIAKIYDQAFTDLATWLVPLSQTQPSAYHIYLIKLNLANLKVDRDQVFQALKAENIGVNVHYKPIYLHSLYQSLGYPKGLCPVAESIYERIITLPLYPTMTDDDISDVIQAVNKVIKYYAK